MLPPWRGSSTTTSWWPFPRPASRTSSWGGLAVNLQGVPRFTADLDIAVALDGPSLATAAGVLRRLGLMPRLPIRDEDLLQPETVRGWISDRTLKALTFVDPVETLREVDVLIDSPVPFDEMERDSDRMTAAGLTIKVASIDTLIRMKSGTGRAQDASDVEALRRLQERFRGR
jgi:hypothetical protein